MSREEDADVAPIQVNEGVAFPRACLLADLEAKQRRGKRDRRGEKLTMVGSILLDLNWQVPALPSSIAVIVGTRKRKKIQGAQS